MAPQVKTHEGGAPLRITPSMNKIRILIEIEQALRALRRLWDEAAFRDQFTTADEIQALMQRADEERRSILAVATQAEVAEYERQREELKQAIDA